MLQNPELGRRLPNGEKVQIPKIEVVRTGGITVRLLPFDHINGAQDLPPALAMYKRIKASAPGVVPFIEYFPPEILQIMQIKLAANSDALTSTYSEFGNIQASYGGLINQEAVKKVLVADPAFDKGFAIPEALPIVGGLIGTVVGGRAALHYWPDRKDASGKALPISRKRLIKTAVAGAFGLTSLSTFVNGQLETQTGIATHKKLSLYTKGFNPPDLPAFISETDFRMVTVAHALKQLGQNVQSTGIKDIALIYPQAHLDRIKRILDAGAIKSMAYDAKFDAYKTMYGLLDIINIREWTRSGSSWKRTRNIPMNFAI